MHLKYRLLGVVIILLGNISLCFAWYNIGILDARSAAMGSFSITTSGLWANYANQAGLALNEKMLAGLHVENRFFQKSTSTRAIAVSVPVNNGGFGLNYCYFGYNRYNESKIGLAFGKKLGANLSAGLQLNYHYLFIAENYGNRGGVSIEGGMLAMLTDEFQLGFHIFNPTGSNIDDEALPVIGRIGASYLFEEKATLGVEVEKELNWDPVLKVGTEYKAYDFLFLRMGVSTLSSQYSFGAGLIFDDLTIDMAFVSHRDLGYSPHLSINYAF